MPPVHNMFADQPYEYEVDLTKKRGSDGEVIPSTGLLDVVMTVSDVSGGAPIHADLTVPMAERSAVPGRYFGIEPTSAINARLKGTYNKKKLYIRPFSASTDIDGVAAESELTFYDVRRL